MFQIPVGVPISKDDYLEMMKIISNDFKLAIKSIDVGSSNETVYNYLSAKNMTLGFCSLIRSRFNILYHDDGYSIIDELKKINLVHQQISHNFLTSIQSEKRGFICCTPKCIIKYKYYGTLKMFNLRMVLSYRKELVDEWLKLNDK